MLNPSLPAPVLIFLAFGVYGLVHSLLASLPAKDLAYTFFGKTAERFYRITYTAFGFVTFLPVIALPALLPDKPYYTVPAPWSYAMLAGQALTILVLLVGTLPIGWLRFVGIPQMFGIKKEEKLFTGGLYRYVRHPIYTATLLFLWLTPIMSQNIASLYLAITAYAFAGAYFEERKLVRIFGQAYVKYRDRTPMIVPNPFRKTG